MNNEQEKNRVSRVLDREVLEATRSELAAAAQEFGWSISELAEEGRAAADAALRQVVGENIDGLPALDASTTAGLHLTFGAYVKQQRKQRGLHVEQLADASDVDAEELAQIEIDEAYEPEPRTVKRLATFFGASHRVLQLLSGNVVPRETRSREQLQRFAAKSRTRGELTEEEFAEFEAIAQALMECIEERREERSS